jgi:hypothetical protein
MLVPACTFSSPDLKLEMNSSSFAVNSRRQGIARSGHFSQGTLRPAGKGAAETVAAAAAAIQPLLHRREISGQFNGPEPEKFHQVPWLIRRG